MDQFTPEEYQAGKVFLFDKEKDWTSFDLVNKLRLSLRNEFGIKKIKVGEHFDHARLQTHLGRMEIQDRFKDKKEEWQNSYKKESQLKVSMENMHKEMETMVESFIGIR